MNKLPLFPKHLHTLSLIRVVVVPSQQPEKNPKCHGNQTQNIIITLKKKKETATSSLARANNRKVLNERWDKTQQQFCCSENLILAQGLLHIFHLKRDKPGTPRLPVWSNPSPSPVEAWKKPFHNLRKHKVTVMLKPRKKRQTLTFKCEQAHLEGDGEPNIGEKTKELAPPAALHIVSLTPIVTTVEWSRRVCSCGFDTWVLRFFHSQANFIALQLSGLNSDGENMKSLFWFSRVKSQQIYVSNAGWHLSCTNLKKPHR